MVGSAKAHYDCVKAFSETDFTDDLKKIQVPTLVMHGTDDQVVPFAHSAPLSAKLLPKGVLKAYDGYPHGMAAVHADVINRDLPEFPPTSASPGGGAARRSEERRVGKRWGRNW